MGKTYSLEEFIKYLPVEKIIGKSNPEIQGIAYDSRWVKDNYLFVAIPGLKENGANYIEEALKKGARAVITQEDSLDFSNHPSTPFILVKNAREALSQVSSLFYNFPSEQLEVIGITGTNGKTSTTYLIESILKSAHLSVGVIGTINYRLGERIIPSLHTTPESLELQALLREMVENQLTHVIMETSSHALSQNRVSRVDFDIAIFSNLSQDHLDYHKNMEGYFASKCLLFEYLGRASQQKGKKFAIVNGDDPSSPKIFEVLKNFPKVEILSFGLDEKNSFKARMIESSLTINRFRLENSSERIEINLSLLGKYNIYNALAAAASSFALGIDFKTIKEGLEKVKSVPGRFEFIEKKLPFKIIVDYAHTELALRNVLEAVRGFNPKRLILVFGCGGDRDRLKRPLMGKVASELADYSILTSDNPRTEEPEKIIAEIEAGFKEKRNYQIIIDRYQAIKFALEMAEPDDLVVVAGKGHEAFQIFKDTVVPFDDREVIKKILAEMGLTADGRRKTEDG